MAMYTTATSSSSSNLSQIDTEVDSESIETDIKRKCLEEAFAEREFCPFKLRWSFGINPDAPTVNLTTENHTLLAYACSHVAVIYDYSTNEMSSLQGHKNAVKTMSTTRDGKWLLTADFGEDCVVVIWDIKKRVPVSTLFNPHGSKGMTAARISPNAKYVVTVGNEKCQNVHFWLWTYGRERPDASLSLIDTESERVKEVTFNDKYPEQFILTTDYHVLFLIWNGDTLSYDYPKIMMKSRRIGVFNGSCYIPKMQQALTATTDGYILVWSNVTCEEVRDNSICEKKKHMKTVNLQKDSITVIADNEGMLVTGSSNGRITFYDYQLRLLYWCQNCDLDSIQCLSFNLQSNLLAPPFSTDMSEEYECPNSKKAMAMISSELTINVGFIPQSYGDNKTTDKAINESTSTYLVTDATLQCSSFNVRPFLACSSTGIIALIDIPKRKCHLVSRHSIVVATSLDTHPESNYIVVGDAHGTVHLYNYEECSLVTSKNIPPLPDFRPLLEEQAINEKIIYVTCQQSHESLKAVTALKFSPRYDMVACGLENGAIWILHHITLDPLDEIPYKHSAVAINKIVFTKCAEYMAYADDALTVVVFKRNDVAPLKKRNIWNLIGKYHSHYLPIRDILFGPAMSDSDVPRFFSVGEDRELVEYDLEHSGPYPIPGLKILQIDQIEQSAIPLCLAWYPECGAERFLMISNSEYKYKIFNDITKTIRGTYLGPIFGKPVQHFQVLTNKLVDDNGYMIFATDKEIGLELLPLDGNPYKIVGMMGHPQKIMGISVSHDRQVMFTIGYNDPCVLMWKIRLRSVDIMAQLGGQGISPFHCLIEGGKKGWLINEMKDLFYYAQILHQGENTAAARIVSDTVAVEQVPNLMRAIGYYPTNEEIENIMGEVCYKHYAETGRLTEEITFEEFARLYVNHRPAFGLSMDQTKRAFCTFVEECFTSMENPTLTREQLMDILLGRVISETSLEDHKPVGEPLTLQEAHTYLRLLLSSDGETNETHYPTVSRRSTFDFDFLPSRIFYKDFTMVIMGIQLPEETRADNREESA